MTLISSLIDSRGDLSTWEYGDPAAGRKYRHVLQTYIGALIPPAYFSAYLSSYNFTSNASSETAEDPYSSALTPCSHVLPSTLSNSVMEQAAVPQQLPVHREACDGCHHRKVRCVSGNGACDNCISLNKSCIFSPRTLMGRPRKRKAVIPLRELRTQPPVTAPPFESPPTASNTTAQHDQYGSSLGSSLISQYMISGTDAYVNTSTRQTPSTYNDLVLQIPQSHLMPSFSLITLTSPSQMLTLTLYSRRTSA